MSREQAYLSSCDAVDDKGARTPKLTSVNAGKILSAV
jgi:hypothetical protein